MTGIVESDTQEVVNFGFEGNWNMRLKLLFKFCYNLFGLAKIYKIVNIKS